MSELSPVIAVTKVENVIKDGQVAPSPILPKSSIYRSEEMHAILLNKDTLEAAQLLGTDSSSVPMLK
eukprot:5605147-Karenia_brevis.AAC.1